VALGKHANNSAPAGHGRARTREELAKARLDRAERHGLLDKLRPVTTLPRVAKCLKVPRTSAGVGVRIGADGRAGLSNLCTCANVWACPVHAAKIGAERAREELTPVIRHVIDEDGGSVVHVIFTTSHHGGLSLEETRRAVQAAWAFLTSHKRWRLIDKEYERYGFTRALEVTWGEKNGWHPHLHVLLYLRKRIDEMDCQRLCGRIFDVYKRGLEQAGRSCAASHGVDAVLATTQRAAETVLARYVTKIASEITRQDHKKGKWGRFSPFELLREAVEQGDAGAMDRWHEYEQAMLGAKLLTWSGKWRKGDDIRTRAGVRKERTDEEIDADEIGDETVVVIPREEWPRVLPKRCAMLDAAEVHGVRGLVDWLDAQGIRWEPPPDLEQAWVPDLDTRRTADGLRRRHGARAVLAVKGRGRPPRPGGP
jgi:hypothetical protein